MKISKSVRHIFIAAGMLASVYACNNSGSQDKKDTKEVAEDHNDAKFNKPGEQDAQAVVDAYSGSMFEMTLSDSVKKYVTGSEVKSLAASMAQAHSDIDGQLKSLAEKKGISLPTALTTSQQDKINNLVDKKIKEIDKNYVDDMIADHKDAIDKFEKCSKDCTDPDIKAWFTAALPELRKHLDMAMACNDKMKSAKK
jgi:putative membrane protein